VFKEVGVWGRFKAQVIDMRQAEGDGPLARPAYRKSILFAGRDDPKGV
jgi:hypothetical protein